MKINNSRIQFLYLFSLLGVVSFLLSCVNVSVTEDKLLIVNSEENNLPTVKRVASAEAKKYWYDGTAEISSFRLTQSRYGELHEGTAVLVYVTEPFSKKSNTKADEHSKANVPILKLNKTKKFTTGIYPYSMMNSTFFPFENGHASLKVSSSLQEWCGMTHLEMKNEGKFIFDFDSYFEGFSFKNKKVKKEILEDDLWSLIRLNPELLPTGEQQIIPSMFFMRLRNRDIKSYKAMITLHKEEGGVNRYELNYPELERVLTIKFTADFPNSILGWEDRHYSGYGEEKTMLTTKAELLEMVKTDYWNQNHNKDKHWRSKLGL